MNLPNNIPQKAKQELEKLFEGNKSGRTVLQAAYSKNDVAD